LIIPGPPRLNHVQSALSHLLSLIPNSRGVRRCSAALAVIRRHISAAKALRTNRDDTSASLVPVVIPAYVDIQRNIRRPSARHGIGDRLSIDCIVVAVRPTETKISGNIGVRHAMAEKP
jgi:hypothetical protein